MNRRNVLLLFAACATFGGSALAATFDGGVTTLHETGSEALYRVVADQSLSSIGVSPEVAFNMLELPEGGILAIDGMPVLPTLTRLVEIIPGTNLKVSVIPGSTIRIRAETPPIAYSSFSDRFVQIQNKILTGIYPEELVSLGKPISLRGRIFQPVTIHIVQFDPVSAEYLIHSNSEISVQGHLVPSFSRFGQVTSSAIRNVLNRRYDRSPGRDDLPVYMPAGKYLVVAREECVEQAIPLLEWKRQIGFEVELLSFGSRDTAEQIKETIQGVYDRQDGEGEEPFDFILIFGSQEAHEDGRSPWVLPSFEGTPSMNVAFHADYVFGLLDGAEDDFTVDAAVGRIPGGNSARMGLAVNRQLAYEKGYPGVEGREGFFRRAGVFAQQWGQEGPTPSTFFTVRWGEELVRSRGFNPIQRYEDFRDDSNGNRIAAALANWFNNRNTIPNLWIGRAQIAGWNDNINEVNNMPFAPFGINVTGHGEFAAEWLFGSGDADNLKGPVVWTTNWGVPFTPYSNGVWQSMINSILVEDLTVGWARAMVGIQWSIRFPHQESARDFYQTDLELYGDPGLRPWTDNPTEVEIVLDQPVHTGSDFVSLHLQESGNNQPFAGALVTLYMAGEMPEPEEYQNFIPILQMTAVTDDQGWVGFTTPDGLPEERLLITASGRNVMPVTVTIELEAAATPNLAVERIQLMEGAVRSGSTIRVLVHVENRGNAQANNVAAIARSLSPFAAIIRGQTDFGNIAPGNVDNADNLIEIHFLEHCPDGFEPYISFEMTSGDQTWKSQLGFDVEAADISVGGLEPFYLLGEELNIRPILTNNGRADFTGGRARLSTTDWRLAVIDSVADYPPIDIDGEAEPANDDRFTLISRHGAISGKDIPLSLILTSQAGIIDTVQILINLRPAEETVGPEPADDYGYSCLDGTDQYWSGGSIGRYLPINPNEEDAIGDGIRLPLPGERPGDARADTSIVIDLPFTLNFYGQSYDEITICTNGFVAVGNQARQVNFENPPMNMATGGALGMIAPFWTKLTMINSGQSVPGIYVYHDEGAGKFIIEWHALHYVQNIQLDLNYQLQILDATRYRSVTGDSPLIMAYDQIRYIERGDTIPHQPPTEYPSIGISSPDGSTGIGVNHDDTLETKLTPLIRRGSVLLFTTTPKTDGQLLGSVIGSFSDSESRPVAGGEVALSAYGLGKIWEGRTGEDGRFFLDNIQPGNYTFSLKYGNHLLNTQEITVEPGEVLDIGAVSVRSDKEAIPVHWSLSSAYPNPFNSSTRILYSVAKSGLVKINLYDLSGRMVSNILEGEVSAGNHSIVLQAGDLPTGLFIIRMEAAEFSQTSKVVLVR